uniref:Uncharacterized protein n=1 Tax=Arundo donax TaxID=35708 RepID=A0A0A9B0D7_ARUDO
MDSGRRGRRRRRVCRRWLPGIVGRTSSRGSSWKPTTSSRRTRCWHCKPFMGMRW